MVAGPDPLDDRGEGSERHQERSDDQRDAQLFAPAGPQAPAISLLRSGRITVPHRRDPAPNATCVGTTVVPTTTATTARRIPARVRRVEVEIVERLSRPRRRGQCDGGTNSG